MSAPKRTWVNSMFSQLSEIENKSESSKRKRRNDGTKPTKITRRKVNTQHLNEEGVVLEDETGSSSLCLNKIGSIDAYISAGNWIDFFAPTNSEELAVHPKKRQELQDWFQHCAVLRRKTPAQLCLLTGPSGSGKTSTVKILAQENNVTIQEWINPVDQENIYNLGDQINSFVSSQADAFKNFLFKASRYRSLLDNNATNKRLLVVEDFPNFLLRDSSVLEDILDGYVTYGKSPLIFIVADSKNRGLNISYNIFTDQIKNKFLINHISFNPIASTLMQKSMKRFCSLMRSSTHSKLYNTPSQDILDSIVVSAQGDIRNALINLHFSSLLGAPKLLTRSLEKVENTRALKKKKFDTKLKSLGCDESVTMMHALGRVFNPKFTENKRFVHSPEELAEAFITEPKKFIDLVQANFITHFSDIEYVLEATDGLSLCDMILNEYRDDSLVLTGLNVGIRSVMVSNKNPVSGWMPIRGQKRLDLNTSKIPTKASLVLPKHHNISSSLYTLDYKSYIDKILT